MLPPKRIFLYWPLLLMLPVMGFALVVAGQTTRSVGKVSVPATSLTAVLNVTFPTPSPMSTPLPPGYAAPDFSLTGMDGKTHRLQDYRGKKVVLNFWASWCAPCRIEMPLLQKVYEQLAGNGVVVLEANDGEDPETVRKFVDEFKLTMPILYDINATVFKRYGVYGLPTTFFLDEQGVIVSQSAGALPDEDLKQYMDEIYATPAVQ